MSDGEHTGTSDRDPDFPMKDPSPASDDLPELGEWAEEVRRSGSPWWSPETKPTARKVKPIFGRGGRRPSEESAEDSKEGSDKSSDATARGPLRFGERRDRASKRREPGKGVLPTPQQKKPVSAFQSSPTELWPPPEQTDTAPPAGSPKIPTHSRNSPAGAPPRRPSTPWRGAPREPAPPAPDPEFGSAVSNTPLTASRRQIERPQRDDLLITEMLPESLEMPIGESVPEPDPQGAASSSWGKRFAHSLSDEEERLRLAAASAKRVPPSRSKNAAGFIAGALLAAVIAYALLRFLGYA